MGQIEKRGWVNNRGYVNPLAYPHTHLLQFALTQDRSRDGKIEDEYLAASLNDKFAFANFPRDALRASRDAYRFNPSLRGVAIRNGVAHMAFHRNDANEAQVGRVHHEHRRIIDGARSPDFLRIFEEEKAKWSHIGTKNHLNHLTYYGAVDTTADLFSAIVDEAKVHPEILHDTVYNDDLYRRITVAKGAKAAIGWVTRSILYGPTLAHEDDAILGMLREKKLERFIPFYEDSILRRVDSTKARAKEWKRKLLTHQSREYLLESQRVNGLGIFFQNITDGGLSTMHATEGIEGLLGNYHKPIAYLEVQIGAINALEHAAELYPRKSAFYKNLAQKMRESTLRQFYMPDKKFFAAAVDHDEITGKYRKVEALSIMGASILNSDLFDSMSDEMKHAYLSPIVERIMSDEFVTDIGLRTKAKHHADLITDPLHPQENVAEYQGSWTVWPGLNEDIILGLRKQGFHDVAEQLENRLLNFVYANSNAEYGFVIPGDVWVQGKKVNLDGVTEPLNYKSKQEFDSLSDEERQKLLEGKTRIDIVGFCPQGDQLWTASAVMRIQYDRDHGLAEHTDPSSWQHGVEQRIFQQNTWQQKDVWDENMLQNFGNGKYFFVIDSDEGAHMEERIRNASEEKRQSLRERRIALNV